MEKGAVYPAGRVIFVSKMSQKNIEKSGKVGTGIKIRRGEEQSWVENQNESQPSKELGEVKNIIKEQIWQKRIINGRQKPVMTFISAQLSC